MHMQFWAFYPVFATDKSFTEKKKSHRFQGKHVCSRTICFLIAHAALRRWTCTQGYVKRSPLLKPVAHY